MPTYTFLKRTSDFKFILFDEISLKLTNYKYITVNKYSIRRINAIP